MSTPIDKFADLLGLGPNSWNERLKPTIVLTSPDGDKYEAKWIGNPRTMSKKLGLFTYPKVKGTVGQDLEVDATTHSITIYFEGRDNDLDSQKFFESCKQRGRWAVTHPVLGFLDLQLVSVTQNMQPVTDGNITTIDTEWIESVDESALTSPAELTGKIDAQKRIFNAQAAIQFADNIRAGTESLKASMEAAVNLVENASEAILAPLNALSDSAFILSNSAQAGIQDTLTAVAFRPITLAGQVQALIQTPLLASNDITARLDYYSDLVSEYSNILARSSGDTNTEAINNAMVCELAMSSVLAANAEIVTTGDILSRTEALEYAQDLSDMLETVTNALDSAQDDMMSNPIDRQYFSQSQAYPDGVLLTYLAIQYLLKTAFELKIEKRFTLDRQRAPIEIAMSEYGHDGWDDSLFDFFVTTNRLQGDQFKRLPAGFEVIVYV